MGDTVILENSDNIQAEVRVSGITENYIYHYAYLSKDTYQTLYGELANNNVIFLKASTEEAVEEALAAKLLTYTDSVSGVSKNSTAMHMMDDTMKSLDSVVWILIISAGLLALVVLYNLSNVNISERIRELATIKVLGFYDREVYDYVSKETMILTIIGIIIGLVAGYFLNLFVIETCELDVIVFNKIVEPISYLYAAAITGGFAIIVNITIYFRLKKIDMIESLKSVE